MHLHPLPAVQDLERVTPSHERQVLPILIAGFALLCCLLLVSGLIAIDSMRFIQTDAVRFAADQQAAMRLINEVQSEESNLSAVFYSLATSPAQSSSALLLNRLDTLQTAIHRTTDIGLASPESRQWTNVRRAADVFLAEAYRTVRSQTRPSAQFFQSHQSLLAAVADLTGSEFVSAEAIRTERERLSSRIQYALALLGAALLLAISGAIVCVIVLNNVFRRLRWQAAELDGLSSRTMSDHEEMARRLSREMHDEFGQTLSAIEANLVSMQRAHAFHPGRIDDCLGLVKDAVENVREVSQLLRPSILDDFGLNASLRWLAETFAERTGKQV